MARLEDRAAREQTERDEEALMRKALEPAGATPIVEPLTRKLSLDDLERKARNTMGIPDRRSAGDIAIAREDLLALIARIREQDRALRDIGAALGVEDEPLSTLVTAAWQMRGEALGRESER